MKKIHKFLVLALAAFLAVGMICSCSKDESSSSSASSTTSSASTTKSGEQKVVINFFHRWPNDPKNTMFKNLIAEYMEENPNVQINMDCILNDQYKEKIRMIVATDEVPDIFSSWSGTFAEEMVASGNVLALDDVYESDPEWADKLAKASVDGFVIDGTTYAIPWSQDGKVFFYNKKIFEENNISIPTTWTEFINVLDTLKAAGYEIPLAAGLADSWAVLHYLGTINQRMVDPEVLAKDYNAATGEFTDPAYVDALYKWQQLTTYMGDIAPGIDHETARNTLFATGQSPIMYLQLAEITQLEQVIADDFEYGFFNFPAFEEGKGDPNALTGAPEGFMISNKAKNTEECIKFLKWLVSEKGGAALTTECGDISCVKGAVNETNALPQHVEALEIISNASQLAPWFDNACDPAVYVVYGQGAQAIATGDETPESVMKQVQEAAAALH